MKVNLEGKMALVTDASSGIGKAIALELGRQGANVGVVYHAEEEAARAVVDEIKRDGHQTIAIQADVSRAADVRRLVQETVGQLGKIDVLVNSSGTEEKEPFLDKTEEEWDRILGADLKGPFLCTQAAAREMVRRNQGGVIVNI
jgi:NAD(P)-dependent dehydrogenase (short-subunit alcohol dehydrogenase family)